MPVCIPILYTPKHNIAHYTQQYMVSIYKLCSLYTAEYGRYIYKISMQWDVVLFIEIFRYKILSTISSSEEYTVP